MKRITLHRTTFDRGGLRLGDSSAVGCADAARYSASIFK